MLQRFPFILLLIAILPLGIVLMGCPTDDDDDDSAVGDDDDDDSINPLAPVLSDLEVEHGGGASACRVVVQFHVEDEDGDLAASDGAGGYVAIPLYIEFGIEQFAYNFTIEGEASFVQDLSLDFYLEEHEDDPVISPDTEYDVEVWLYDVAGNESNHLVEEGYETPATDCT